MSDPFYTKTATIWNKSVSGRLQTETWYPTVIENVRLLVSKGNNVERTGNENADSARLHIDDVMSIADKPYTDPKAWNALQDKSAAYTLDETQDTFFTEGDTSAEAAAETDNFFEHMKQKYYHVFHVSSVDRFDLIGHFEVFGR